MAVGDGATEFVAELRHPCRTIWMMGPQGAGSGASVFSVRAPPCRSAAEGGCLGHEECE